MGNPFKRPTEKVREEVLDELLSIEGAKENYGLVLDPVTLEADAESTEKLRKLGSN